MQLTLAMWFSMFLAVRLKILEGIVRGDEIEVVGTPMKQFNVMGRDGNSVELRDRAGSSSVNAIEDIG